MTAQSTALLAAFVAGVLLLAMPMGRWLAAVAQARPSRLETAWLGALGAAPEREHGWREYAVALLVFNVLGVIVVFAIQLLQGALPLNPQHFGAVSLDSAFNTAVSFVTNTNWQGYAGESTMSNLTQALALTVQNFLSAATGIAVAFALIRGFARGSAQTLGNFWVDLTRIVLAVLLPLSVLLALVFAAQGVVQSFAPNLTLGSQTLPMGPIASQEAIKMLGTNGGGFLNANSAHPFENPSAWSNLLQMLAILVIPAGLCLSFGRMVGDQRQGWTLLLAMTLIFVAAVVAIMVAEQAGNPKIGALGVDQAASAWQAGGNMEGKETRFGIAASALFTAVTTAASCGAVNSMLGSFTPLGGAVPMLLMQLGEVVFGGVGSGLYGMLIFALLTVFIAGLMIGRTPEYLGKKIAPADMKLVAIAILVTPLLVLTGTAIAVLVDAGKAGMANPGAQGFAEVLYAFSSAANNNGSAFAGLSANTPFYNLMLAAAMWFGRFSVIVPVLALAGALAAKKRVQRRAEDGSVIAMPTHGPLFVALLISSVLLVGALTYLPAIALGPLVEHLNLWK